MTLELFDKHPEADAYRVGGAYQPYAIVAVDKRFSDAELAAEVWKRRFMYAEASGRQEIKRAHERMVTIERFATLPHAHETNYE